MKGEETIVYLFLELSLVFLFAQPKYSLRRLYAFLYTKNNLIKNGVLYLNFSHVKTNRNVLSSQIKQFTVLIRQASFHAINCVKSYRKVYQIGGCFDNFVTWTYSGKKL